MLLIIIKCFLIVLLIDFITGIFHWLEDSYGTEKTPILGKHIIAPNRLHHKEPRFFVQRPVWRRNRTTSSVAIIILSYHLFNDSLTWTWALFLGAFINEIHCWSHRSPKENGTVINFMHCYSLVQTPKHHSRHHRHPNNTCYCTFTNLLNPLLDRIGFFKHLELFIEYALGIKSTTLFLSEKTSK